mgnify:CR=1 FL=1
MLLLYNKSGIYHTKNCAGYYDKVLVPQSSDAPFLRGVISLYRLYRKIQIQEAPQCFHTGLVLT